MFVHIYNCPLVDRITDLGTKYQLPSQNKSGNNSENILSKLGGNPREHYNMLTAVIIFFRDFATYWVIIFVCDFLPQKFRLCGGGELEVIGRQE